MSTPNSPIPFFLISPLPPKPSPLFVLTLFHCQFGWNFLHRFILGWHLWRLNSFLKLFLLPRIIPLPPEIFLFLNVFPMSDFDETCYIDSFWDFIFGVRIFLSKFPPSLNFVSSPNLFLWFWTLSHCPIQIKSLHKSVFGWDLWRFQTVMHVWISVCINYGLSYIPFNDMQPPIPSSFLSLKTYKCYSQISDS